MGWLEYVIFAMGPLGIITAVVSAIRVGGPGWMKAIIGRARENLATVELELMSLTSSEVCEIWNGEGVVRLMGRAEVKEIIYLDERDDDGDTFGLFTFEVAKEAATTEAAAKEAAAKEAAETPNFSSIAEISSTISITDFRAATPSQAAEIVVPLEEDQYNEISEYKVCYKKIGRAHV